MRKKISLISNSGTVDDKILLFSDQYFNLFINIAAFFGKNARGFIINQIQPADIGFVQRTAHSTAYINIPLVRGFQHI